MPPLLAQVRPLGDAQIRDPERIIRAGIQNGLLAHLRIQELFDLVLSVVQQLDTSVVKSVPDSEPANSMKPVDAVKMLFCSLDETLCRLLRATPTSRLLDPPIILGDRIALRQVIDEGFVATAPGFEVKPVRNWFNADRVGKRFGPREAAAELLATASASTTTEEPIAAPPSAEPPSSGELSSSTESEIWDDLTNFLSPMRSEIRQSFWIDLLNTVLLTGTSYTKGLDQAVIQLETRLYRESGGLVGSSNTANIPKITSCLLPCRFQRSSTLLRTRSSVRAAASWVAHAIESLDVLESSTSPSSSQPLSLPPAPWSLLRAYAEGREDLDFTQSLAYEEKKSESASDIDNELVLLYDAEHHLHLKFADSSEHAFKPMLPSIIRKSFQRKLRQYKDDVSNLRVSAGSQEAYERAILAFVLQNKVELPFTTFAVTLQLPDPNAYFDTAENPKKNFKVRLFGVSDRWVVTSVLQRESPTSMGGTSPAPPSPPGYAQNLVGRLYSARIVIDSLPFAKLTTLLEITAGEDENSGRDRE